MLSFLRPRRSRPSFVPVTGSASPTSQCDPDAGKTRPGGMERIPNEVLDLVVQEAVASSDARGMANGAQVPSSYWRRLDRYSILGALGQVNRVWASVAQPRMVETVSFDTSSGLASAKPDALFCFAVFTMPKWAKCVRCLHLAFLSHDTSYPAVDQKLAAIISGLPHLVALCIDFQTDIKANFPSAWQALLALKTVEHLAVRRVVVNAPFPSLLVDTHAGHLKSFEVEDVDNGDGLCATVLPRLGSRLQALVLRDTFTVTDIGAAGLALTSLQLGWLRSTSEGTRIAADLLVRVASTLRAIQLSNSAAAVFKDVVTAGTGFPELRSLAISDDIVRLSLPDLLGILDGLVAPQLADLSLLSRRDLCGALTSRFAHLHGLEPRHPCLRRLELAGETTGFNRNDYVAQEIGQAGLQTVLLNRPVQLMGPRPGRWA